MFGVGINAMLGQRISTAAAYFNPDPLPPMEGRNRVDCSIPKLPLAPGRYTVDLVQVRPKKACLTTLGAPFALM